MEFSKEEVLFTAWANGGSALGKLADGRVVFAFGVIPGEIAEVQWVEKNNRFVSAEVVRLIRESDKRIAPRCPLFGQCSLCQLQFLTYADQLAAKQEILADHLVRIGKITDARERMLPILPAPAEWNYRRCLTLYPMAEGSFCLPDRKGNALRLEAWCPIATGCINELLPSLDFDTDDAVDALEIRQGDDDELQLILHGQSKAPETESETDMDLSMVYAGPEGSYVMTGVSTLLQTAAGVQTAYSDSSDFPENPESLTLPAEKLRELIPAGTRSVWDIRCGNGFWSKWFADIIPAVNGIDPDERNAEDFALNLEEAEDASLYIGPLAEVLGGLKPEDDALIFAEGCTIGFPEEELELLNKWYKSCIIYLSTDPAILARDAARITAKGRRLRCVIPFDPAPQTAQIGALAVFDPCIAE